MKRLYFVLLTLCLGTVAMAQPTNNATEPPIRDTSDVIGIYGDAYPLAEITNYDPNWGQSGHMMVNPEFDPGTGNVIMAYPNFNYQGTEFNGVDASLFEFLHIDIWVPIGTERLVKVSPIDNSGTGAQEVLVDLPTSPGQWMSVDLAKEDFTDMTWNSVGQLKIDGQFNPDGSQNTEPFDIYIDNVYFWKMATATGTDATLSDLQVDGETVAGFASGQLAYTYGVPAGVTTIPQITMATPSDVNATVDVQQASQVPGDAAVTITSANGANSQTYTVSYFISSPAMAAPTPSLPANQVISLFSDAYTDVPVDFWNTDWSEADLMDVVIDGNATKLYTTVGFNGIETTSSPIDATDMMTFNMDVWSANMDNIDIKLVDWLEDGFGGVNGDTEGEITVPLSSGEWTTISIPLSDFTNAGMTAQSDINQIILTSDPFGFGTFYLDNVYYAATTVSTEEQIALDAVVYPNPVSTGQRIAVEGDVEQVEVYQLGGQLVSKTKPANMPTLPVGQYILRLSNEEGATTVRKIIVQ